MAKYIDEVKYDEELRKCIINDELSRDFLAMFRKHCLHVGKRFYLATDDIREDAISTATHDLCKYWKTFNIYNCAAIKLCQNFVVGDRIIIDIKNHGIITITISEEENYRYDCVALGRNENITLKNIVNLVKEKYQPQGIIRCTNYTVKKKLSIIDIYNKKDMDVFSEVSFHFVGDESRLQETVFEDKFQKTEKINSNCIKYTMLKSSNAFSFLTSLITNSMINSLNDSNPKELRDGNRVPLSRLINAEGSYEA